jgi:hypothetical protein
MEGGREKRCTHVPHPCSTDLPGAVSAPAHRWAPSSPPLLSVRWKQRQSKAILHLQLNLHNIFEKYTDCESRIWLSTSASIIRILRLLQIVYGYNHTHVIYITCIHTSCHTHTHMHGNIHAQARTSTVDWNTNLESSIFLQVPTVLERMNTYRLFWE